MSSSFHRVPDSVERTWSLSTMNLTAAPISNAALDTTYESPIRQIQLKVDFLNSQAIENLKYVVDESSFVPEWEFAQESWETLVQGVTTVITEYNKSIIARAREVGLNSVSVVGKAKNTYIHDQPVFETPIQSPPVNRVETIYEPSVRSTATTRRSAAVRPNPIFEWMASTRPKR
jgi:uncharacterized protein with NAD-binding domain and iron-sulfur cluster